ncbi:MAG: hypothetical protein ACYTGX_04015 [Planctomycetota bacterium]|jgi:hypothetical protein
MKLGRRTELLIGSAAFSALGGALVWQGLRYAGGAPVRFGVLGELGAHWSSVASLWFLLLGGLTVLSALLFVRVRWTPPLPGPPVGPASDGGPPPAPRRPPSTRA